MSIAMSRICSVNSLVALIMWSRELERVCIHVWSHSCFVERVFAFHPSPSCSDELGGMCPQSFDYAVGRLRQRVCAATFKSLLRMTYVWRLSWWRVKSFPGSSMLGCRYSLPSACSLLSCRSHPCALVAHVGVVGFTFWRRHGVISSD